MGETLPCATTIRPFPSLQIEEWFCQEFLFEFQLYDPNSSCVSSERVVSSLRGFQVEKSLQNNWNLSLFKSSFALINLKAQTMCNVVLHA